MTDDSDDDRMDRARRIREMREGNRPDADDADDADGDTGVEPDGAGAGAGPEGDDDRGDPEADTGGADTAAGPTSGPDETDEGPAGSSGRDDSAEGIPDDVERPAEGADAGTGADSGEEVQAGAGVDVPTDEDGVPQLPGIDMDDADVDAAQLVEQAGLDTGGDGGAGPGGGDGGLGPGGGGAASAGGAAVASGGDDGEARAVGMAGSSGAVTGRTAADETRVLEFALGEERYCLDIDHVEEIVKRETVTRVPNTPDYVEGVVDLRGQITTILDPKVLFDIEAQGAEELIVVFDPEDFEDQGAIGWLVDDVNQVMPVAESEVNESPVDEDHVEGVVERDEEFVIWTNPELAVEDATG